MQQPEDQNIEQPPPVAEQPTEQPKPEEPVPDESANPPPEEEKKADEENPAAEQPNLNVEVPTESEVPQPETVSPQVASPEVQSPSTSQKPNDTSAEPKLSIQVNPTQQEVTTPAPKVEATPREASIQSPNKRSDLMTEEMYLVEEVKALKESLLQQVDALIVRQNAIEPVVKIETFEVETASRRVLKELVETYVQVQNDQNKKIKEVTTSNDLSKRRIEAIESMLKRIQSTISDSLAFGKRLTLSEQKLETIKDQSEKRHDAIKDLVGKTKDMLEARVDQVCQFEDKITILSDELTKSKSIHEEFRKKMINEISKTNSEQARMRQGLNQHVDEYKAAFLNNEFYMDKNNAQMMKNEKYVEQLKQYLDGKIEQISFEVSTKVRIEDMKQNFKQLNDILVIKFKQVEDTKEACRNLITYQKFFHQIQTQQLISENLMALKVARQDENFMNFQKKVYDDFNERTRLECKMAAKIFDYDLKSHLEQLESYHIKGNDFMPFPLGKDVQHDFVQDLLYRYLQDIKQRQKMGEFGRASSATLLKKCTKLDDIEVMIEDLQKKSNDLLSNAEKMAVRLAEEAKQKEIANNIRRLATKKLDFKPRHLYKRNNSFKGRDNLLLNQYEQEEFDLKVYGNPDEKRPSSKKIDRSKEVKLIDKKANPFKMGQSGFSKNDEGEEDEEEAKPKDRDQQLQSMMPTGSEEGGMNQMMKFFQQMQAAQKGAPGQPMLDENGNPIENPMGFMFNQGSQSMDRQEKRKLMAEIKEEMKVLITQISDYQVEQAVTLVKTQLRKLESENEMDKKRIVERFENELANITEYFKKQVQDVRKDFTDDIRSMQKLRARDKSDADTKFEEQGDKIFKNASEIMRHNDYFNVLAQTISILTENLNMQMEAEYADLLDRKLMSLYGIQDGKPTKMDQSGAQTKVITKYKKNQDTITEAPTQASGNRKNMESISRVSSQEKLFQNDASIEQYLDAKIPRIDSIEGLHGASSGTVEQSMRHDLPIKINSKCLSHQTSGQDSQLTLKLFKLACLAYNPSTVKYREMTLDRKTMIFVRRGLIDKITNLLPQCILFKDNAIYPRRYFDDLMVEENLTHNVGVGTSPTISVMDQFDQRSQKILGLNSSPNLNSNSSRFLPTLPEIHGSIDNLAFGIGKKNDYTASLNNSRQFLEHVAQKKRSQNQSMNIALKQNISSRNDLQTFMPSINKIKLGDPSRSDFQGLQSSNKVSRNDEHLDSKRPNFDIEGIIKSPNTNIKMHAIGYHKNLKKMAYLNSTAYSRAPAVTNSLSTISPIRARKAGVNNSLSIDVDTPVNLANFLATPQAQVKQDKHRETNSDFPRI